MNRQAMVKAFFDEYYVAPAAPEVDRTRPRRRSFADRMINTVAATSLVAVLECLCSRELQRYIKVNDEAPVVTQMYCRQCAPVPVGSLVRMTGWVERLGNAGLTFRVMAQDEHEQVCDGQIQFAIVKCDQMVDALSRKHEAIARREMFAPA